MAKIVDTIGKGIKTDRGEVIPFDRLVESYCPSDFGFDNGGGCNKYDGECAKCWYDMLYNSENE